MFVVSRRGNSLLTNPESTIWKEKTWQHKSWTNYKTCKLTINGYYRKPIITLLTQDGHRITKWLNRFMFGVEKIKISGTPNLQSWLPFSLHFDRNKRYKKFLSFSHFISKSGGNLFRRTYEK
jgi:hypothetical protein